MLKPLAHALSALDAELPARPQTLVRLLGLLQNEACTLTDIAELVESDMTLSAALIRTVNSAMFGLLRRVQTVGEAVRYLGVREVAAITFETALRNAFPPTPDLERLWQRSSMAGLLMGRAAARLDLDALLSHTAGLFERCGQAVLLVKAKDDYLPLMQAHADDRATLLVQEQAMLGVTHTALGSALCASWGIANGAVRYVRDSGRCLGAATAAGPTPERRLGTLGRIVNDMLDGEKPTVAAALHAPGSGVAALRFEEAVLKHWEPLKDVWRDMSKAFPPTRTTSSSVSEPQVEGATVDREPALSVSARMAHRPPVSRR